MSKKKPKMVQGDVWAKESEALAKSIAKDLNLPDKPISMQEWAKIDPLTGKPREFGEHDIRFNLEHSDGTEEDALEDQIERNRMEKLDRDVE